MNKTLRQSNFEMLRIVAMMLVLVVHACFVSVVPHGHAAITAPGADLMKLALVYVMESLALVCVNLFVVISGYFSIRLSLRSAASLAFQLLFWCGLQGAVWLCIGRISWSQFGLWLCGGGHSFVPCYFMLMLVSPALNAFVDTTGKSRLARFILLYFMAQTVFGWAFEAWPFGSGSSLPLFIGLYLGGRYLALYCKNLRPGFTKGMLGYAGVSVATGLTVFALVAACGNDNAILHHFTSYASPFNLICVTLIILAVRRLTFTSRTVNRLAQSAFAVYLAHMYPPTVIHYRRLFAYIYNESPAALWPVAMLATCAAIYLTVAVVDCLRIALWHRIASRLPI